VIINADPENVMSNIKKINMYLFMAAGVYLFLSCSQSNKTLLVTTPSTTEHVATEDIDGKLDFLNREGKILAAITIEIADTIQQQEKGLMNRPHLSPTHGMLFVFDKPDYKSFWMRNTLIPLDIIFIDAELTVTQILRNATPLSTTSHTSKKPILYVVEVNAGFANRYHIQAGTRIQWQRI